MESRQTERQSRKRLLEQRAKQRANRAKSNQSTNDPKIGYFAQMGWELSVKTMLA